MMPLENPYFRSAAEIHTRKRNIDIKKVNSNVGISVCQALCMHLPGMTLSVYLLVGSEGADSQQALSRYFYRIE